MNAMLGERIRVLRNAKKMTQEQVAQEIGVSRQKYARIENGTNSVTLEILVKVAGVFKVTVADITKVLDEEPVIEFRSGSSEESAMEMFEMLDLFYANKHLYNKIKNTNT